MNKIQKYTMTTLFKKLVMKKTIYLNHFAALFVFIFALGVGKTWGTTYYYTGFKATGGDSGKGYVYSSTSESSTPAYDTEVVGEEKSGDTGSSSGTNTYYAWAKAVRGSAFKEWSVSNASGSAKTGEADAFTVTSSVGDDIVTGVVTAIWTTYNEVNVTYYASDDGEYTVAYSYNSYNSTEKTITAGDAEGLSCTVNSDYGNQTIGSYYNDVITLTSTKGTFQGWYSDAGFTSKLSDANPYTYVAPKTGTGSIYPKYVHVDKYYGRLTASIAAVPYSMPAGGKIFISKEAATPPIYSETAQTVDNVGMGTTGLTYYLKAQPTDKRYVFRGWYSNAECTGTALSTNEEYTYTFTASSLNSASPTTGNIYAAFDFNLYYMEVSATASASSEGLGMVLVRGNNTGTPEYTEYSYESSQFAYAYRLAPTATVYLYAKPKYGYKFSGWYDNPECSGDAIGTNNPQTYAATGSSTDPLNPTIVPVYAKFVEDATTINITYNLPDQTKGEYSASVLDIAEVDDEYVWTFTEVFTSVGKTANTTQAQHKAEVLRLEAEPITGYGVTSWTIAGAAKSTPSHLYETSATAAATYGVTFGDAKPFLVSASTSDKTGTAYATLAEALSNLGSNKKITVVQSAYVPAGNYTIPSGVTLLVPYNADYSVNTTPSTVTSGTPSRSVYATLTLGDGATINVNGSICVNAIMCLTMGYNGSAMNGYGLIDLNAGSQIKLNNGTNCYVWGFIIGNGTITAESGATLHETFQFKHRGGNALSAITDESSTKKVFPINQYYIQSIEAPITIKKGATEKVYTGVHNVNTAVDIDFIGTSGLFNMTGTNAYLIKRYDVSKDRQEYSLYGDATIGSIKFGMSGFYEESKDYVLPITNNMTLNVESGTTTIQYETAILPDVQVRIAEGAKITTSDNCFVYDSLGWKGAYAYACQYAAADQVTNQIAPVVYRHGGLKYKRKSYKLRDATIDVIGELSGVLYTTNGGANIMSSRSGKVTVSGDRSETTTYQVGQDDTSPTFDAISITSARLRNGDGSYTSTAGASSSDQFLYNKNMQQWLKNPKMVTWNANGGTTEATTMAYSEGAFIGELPAAYKDGYTLAGWFTAASGGTQIAQTQKVTADVTYYAHWTPKTYTITYMDEGKTPFSGTHVDSPNAHPTTHTYGTATTLNSATKTGDTFGGWYTVSSCRAGTEITSIGATAITKDITLYAKWINKTLAISASPADYGSVSHTSLSVPAGTTITSSGNSFTVNGTTVTATPIPSTAAYTYAFERWHNLPATVTKSASILAVFSSKANVASVTAGGVTTYHTTLEDAISTANGKTGATVTMLQNVTITSEITISAAMTIDLNGKTISSTQAAATTGVFKINASGKTVTIVDGGTGGKIDHTASVNGHIYGLYLTAGSLQIDGGTIYAKNNASANSSYRAYGIYTYDKASSITISNGTIEGTSLNMAFGIYAGNSCAITMTGGEIKSSGTNSIRGIYTQGATNLTNATITATATTGTDCRTFFIKSGTNLTINSGTYTATGATGSIQVVYQQAGTVTINGGKFSATDVEFIKDAGTTYIKGGVYKHDTNLSSNCAANHYVYNLTSGADYNVGYRYEVAAAYTLSWVTDGDELTGVYTSGQTRVGTTIIAPNTPTKTGYNFAGWSPTVAGTMPAANTTYTATWTGNTHKLVWDFAGGEATSAYTEGGDAIEYGTTIIYPTLSKTGYTFAGWSSSDETMPDNDLTITASWTVNSHSLTWNANGGTLSGDYTSGTVAYGTTIVAPTVTRENYIFNGWNTTPASTMPDNDLTYTASWTLATASVTVPGGTPVYYTSLSSAWSAANGKAECTIKLIKKVTGLGASSLVYTKTNGKCTLDLNNLSISGAVSSASDPKVMYINASGCTFTITDNSEAKGGKFSMTMGGGRGAYCAVQVAQGTLVMAGGTIYAESSRAWVTSDGTGYSFQADAVRLEDGTAFQMTGGTLEAKSQIAPKAVYAKGNNNITISGGTLIATATVTASGAPNSNPTALYIAGGTTTITDGSFTATTQTNVANSIYATSASQTITISGGKFNATGGSSMANINSAAAAANITLQGGYYSHNTNLAKYEKAPYYVFDLEGQSPYLYEVAEAYTITFKNGEETVQSGIVKKGTTPVYSGSTPTKPADAQYTYTHSGWTPDITPVTAAATYTATFSSTPKSYELTWNVNGGNELTGTYTHGSTPYGTTIVKPADPTRTGYTFAGWSDGTSIVTPTTMPAANTTYTATWTCVSPSPSITSDKWDFCAGESMTLTVSGSGIAADAKYLWKISKDGGSTYTNAPGTNNEATYTVASMAAANAGKYTCTVTNGSCSTTSAGVDVKVWYLYINNGTSGAWQDIPFTNNTGTKTGSANVTLEANQSYGFKLWNEVGASLGYYGLDSKSIISTESNITLNNTGDNVGLTSGIGGTYVFTIDYSSATSPKISVTYPTANQPSGSKIYFDKSIIDGWGDNVYYRIGHSSYNTNQSLSLVPGTDQFYEMTTNGYDGFEAWQIANNTSWSNDNSIYLVNGSGYAITKATNFQKYVVDASGITIVPTTENNTENGCNYWHVLRPAKPPPRIAARKWSLTKGCISPAIIGSVM